VLVEPTPPTIRSVDSILMPDVLSLLGVLPAVLISSVQVY